MRIVHVVGRSHRRGAEQVAMELAAELDLRGHHNRVVAVSLGHDGDRIDAVPPLVQATRHGPQTLLRASRRLRRDLRVRPADVILAHGAAAASTAILASPRRGPVIIWQRIIGLPDRSFGLVLGTWWRVAVHRLDGVVALTEAMGEELGRLGYRGPVAVIPNARRRQRFIGLAHAASSARLRAELGVGPNTSLVGLVGYLVPQKAPVRAVEVLARLRASGGAEVHLVVAGSGPLAEEVRGAAERLGVGDATTLLGHRDDIEQVLAGIDALLLTSVDEGVPGVLVEAAMAGCPVVSFPLAGIGEVVADGVTGLVLAEPTVSAMAETVRELLDDPDRRAAMAAAARVHAADFAMEAVAPRYEAVLRTAVAASPMRSSSNHGP